MLFQCFDSAAWILCTFAVFLQFFHATGLINAGLLLCACDRVYICQEKKKKFCIRGEKSHQPCSLELMIKHCHGCTLDDVKMSGADHEKQLFSGITLHLI